MPRQKPAAPSRLTAAERAGSTWNMGEEEQEPGPSAPTRQSPDRGVKVTNMFYDIEFVNYFKLCGAG